MSDTPKQDIYAQSLVEQLSDLVDGLALLQRVAFGEEHEAAPAKASNTIDLSEWFASVYGAS
jgi:hypothetical protein